MSQKTRTLALGFHPVSAQLAISHKHKTENTGVTHVRTCTTGGHLCGYGAQPSTCKTHPNQRPGPRGGKKKAWKL